MFFAILASSFRSIQAEAPPAQHSQRLPIGSSLPVTVSVKDTSGKELAPNFLGLSYEFSMVRSFHGRNYFDPADTALVETFRTLGIKSLRVGANAVDYALAPDPQPNDIDLLFAFARKAGVKVIFSFRLREGNPATSARLAKYIAGRYADLLDSFAIGNESQFYTNKSFEEFFRLWKPHYDAIVKAVPNAKIAGPDSVHDKVGGDYCRKLADALVGQKHLVLITQHSYPLGDSRVAEKDPDEVRKKFLSREVASKSLQDFYDLAARDLVAHGIRFRIAEMNSCHHGGARGSSDSYAAALWALDWLHRWSLLGIDGVNFHSGDSDKMRYTVFLHHGDGQSGIDIRPIGYGLLAFSQGAIGKALPVETKATAPLDLTAYAFRAAGGNGAVTLINMSHGAEATNVVVTLQLPREWNGGRWERIDLKQEHQDIGATTGVLLGEASISSTGTWAGKWRPISLSTAAPPTVHVAPCSAVILRLVQAQR